MRGDTNAIYLLRITLDEIIPRIWRSLLVPGSISLSKLHTVFQVVMGWTDSHLHQFHVGGVTYKLPDPDFGFEKDERSERGKRLSQIAPAVRTRFGYDYDFGDNWQHDVLIEKIVAADPDRVYPVCLAGERACPPEDCGGVGGYGELLKILKNPRHPEYSEIRQWAGADYDPEAFDLTAINLALSGLAIPVNPRNSAPPKDTSPDPSAPAYTDRQGQFLAFIYYYTKLNRRAPAEADMQAYFQVSAPAVHQMVVTLEQRGLISRIPGQARSIRLALPRGELPDLD